MGGMDTVTCLPRGALESNYVPSPAEESLLRNSLIPQHVAKVQELDIKIQRARILLTRLELERQKEDQILQAHQALLSPMRRLITDVLLEIFHRCHARNLEEPMRLADVCRQWRHLIHSCPTLWSTVMIHDAMPLERILLYTRACIKYSGTSPLKVVVKFLRRRPRSEHYQKAIIHALELLSVHVERWQVYHVFIDETYRLLYNHVKLPDVAPGLEELVVLFQGSVVQARQSAIYTSSDVPLIVRCKRLRRLSIDDGIRGLTLEDCWNILRCCSKVQHFEITGIKDVPENSQVEWHGQVYLPDLRVLCIGPHASDPSQLIHGINTSKLERVQILVGRGSIFDSSCISNLVTHSGYTLRNLSLVYLDCAVFASLLPLLPNLTHLNLQHAIGIDILLKCLSNQVHGSFYCPNLQALALRLSLFTGGHLIHFAQERRKFGTRIQVIVNPKTQTYAKDFEGLTIVLYMVGEFSDNELKELHDLQTDGDPT